MENKYVCPFHYIGGKSKLLESILPEINKYCPEEVIDLFAGGFSVGVNCKATTVVYNDINYRFTDVVRWIYANNINSILQSIRVEIEARGLNKTNPVPYQKLKDDYNLKPTPILLFLLICYSFNHQMRFNKTGIFNTPFGKNRSSYNLRTERALIDFSNKIKKKNISFSSLDFELIFPKQNKSLVFVDPPYILSTGSYNDGNRGIVHWNYEDEERLYKYLDKLNSKGHAFLLTNFVKSGNLVNERLKAFSRSYNSKIIDSNYNNSNYHKKQQTQIEILVKNF